MLASLLLAAAFQVGPFYEQKPDASAYAFRPFWSTEGETTDVLWPLFTAHRDWWRFALFVHDQQHERGHQFDILPLWWHGCVHPVEDDPAGEVESYWGLFPLWGHHPHILLLHDFDFALWPVWMRYRMPRPGEKAWMTTNAVCWPFVHWRDDGSWGVWPLYTCNRQRESYHQAALWPIVTWASYEADRDTAGAGSSWMVWPLVGGVTREREDQWLFLPPFFSWAETRSPKWGETNSAPEMRIRCPWPFVEFEATARRDRLSVWPFYEYVRLRSYGGDEGGFGTSSVVYRFGWKLVELYDDETRVFPFWVSRADDTYFRLWPFWESSVGEDGVRRGRFLSLFPIRNVPSVDRNWAKFWTLYESAEGAEHTDHSLFWGLIRWRTDHD